MTTSYANAVDEIFRVHEKAKIWTTGNIDLQVATSFTNDHPQVINLSESIGHNKRVPRPNMRNDSTCYWLPQSFNQNTEKYRKDNIHPYFATACYWAGFLVHAQYETAYKCIRFECNMAKYHDEAREKKYAADRERIVKDPSVPPEPRDYRRTTRPVKGVEGEVRCKFKFRVHWDEKTQRWFLPRQQSGDISHCGHIHESPELLRIQSHLAPQKAVEVAEDALDSFVPTAATGSLFNKRTGMHLEQHQLRYLKQRKKNDLVMEANDSLDVTEITAVDRLIADLKKDPQCSYVCLYGEYNSKLLTIKTKKKGMNNAETIEEFNEELGDDTDNPKAFAEDYCKSRSSLKDSSNGKIVLAIAWTNDEARRKFDMFPEFLGGDDTEDTNSEDRPLYTMCGKDSMNKSFGHTWCFMPSKAQWVYQWIFGNAMPILHPGTALTRVQQFATDADPQETRAAVNCCGRGSDLHKVLPHARHRHCAWHKVNRNFTEDSKYKSKLSATRKRSWKSSVEVDVVVRWLWYFIKYYESPEEVDLAYRLLSYYLNEDQAEHHGDIEEDVRSAIRDFITKSFYVNSGKLFESEFDGVMTLGNVTTAVNEAEHRVYKYHCQGVQPSDDLAKSAKKINKINKDKEASKSRKVAADMRGTVGKASKREEVDDRLTDYSNEKLLHEHKECPKHCLHRPSEYSFYVKRKYYDHCTTPEEDLELPERVCSALFEKIDIDNPSAPLKKKARKQLRDCKEALFSDTKKALDEYKVILKRVMKHVIPRYERTRTVRIVNGSCPGEKVMTCDCKWFLKWGLACRHMYKVLGRHPKVQDAKVRWLIAYNYYYGRNEAVSKQLVKIRDECNLEGVPLSAEEWAEIDSRFAIGESDSVPLEYFTCSLGKLRLRGANYWQTVSGKLQGELGIDPSVFGHVANAEAEKPSSADLTALGSKPFKSNVPAAPIGVQQDINCNSEYKVPSQASNGTGGSGSDVEFEGGSGDLDVDSDEDLVFEEKLTGNPYLDFLPMYSTNTKLSKGLGSEGRDILRSGMRALRTDLLAAHARADARSKEMPKVNSGKRNAERYTKPGSPSKKKGSK